MLDNLAINIDIFLWICINEYNEMKLWQLDAFLAALKGITIEHNGQSELLFNDFEACLK